MQKITNESYDTLFVRELAKRLQQKTGIEVKEFADCKLISDRMNLNGFHVSGHTIARFLGILKGMESKNFMLGHIVRLRAAGMEDVQV